MNDFTQKPGKTSEWTRSVENNNDWGQIPDKTAKWKHIPGTSYEWLNISQVAAVLKDITDPSFKILPMIDIREVITAYPGQKIYEPYIYRVGDPAADTIALEWYLNPDDQLNRTNRQEEDGTVPGTYLFPSSPILDLPEKIQVGEAIFSVPLQIEYETLYPKILIYKR